MPNIRHPEIEIYYETEGAGAPLVCISGLGADHSAWAFLRPELSRRFRLVVFDNRGIGRTKAPDAPFNIDRLVRDTLLLMDALGVERAVVAGHSMGCAVALSLGRCHPERVQRLVLFAPFMRLPERAIAAFRANASLWRAGVPPAQLFPVIMPWLFSDDFLADGAKAAALVDLVAGLPLMQTAIDFERQLDAVAEFDAASWLAEVRQPTRLVAGQHDILTPPKAVQNMAVLLPNAEFITLPTAHACLAEAPEDCVRLIEQA